MIHSFRVSALGITLIVLSADTRPMPAGGQAASAQLPSLEGVFDKDTANDWTVVQGDYTVAPNDSLGKPVLTVGKNALTLQSKAPASGAREIRALVRLRAEAPSAAADALRVIGDEFMRLAENVREQGQILRTKPPAKRQTGAPSDRRLNELRRHARDPAAAGLARGEYIVEVNGKPGKDYTLNELRALFRGEGKFNLTVERQGKRRPVVLDLKR